MLKILTGVKASMEDKKVLKETIRLLRLQKHDILNYLQVILGYLQLNKEAEAKKHLKEAIDVLQKKASFLKIDCPQLAINLLILTNEAFKMEIPIDIQCKTTFSSFEGDENVLTQLVNIIWRTCVANELRLHKDKRRIMVIIDENDNIIFSTNNSLNCFLKGQIDDLNLLAKQINYNIVLRDEKLVIKKI